MSELHADERVTEALKANQGADRVAEDADSPVAPRTGYSEQATAEARRMVSDLRRQEEAQERWALEEADPDEARWRKDEAARCRKYYGSIEDALGGNGASEEQLWEWIDSGLELMH